MGAEPEVFAAKVPGLLSCEMAEGSDEVVVPRIFKLLDEYDASIGKGGVVTLVTPEHDGLIQYGMDEDKAHPDANPCENSKMHYWRGIIIGPQGTAIGEFFYNFEIFVPDEYPLVPPDVRFIAPKIKMECVGPDGRVNTSRIKTRGGYFKWTKDCNIANVLCALRSNMHDPAVPKASAALGDKPGY